MEVSGKRADDVSKLCDVCQSNSANGFCNDCKEYMCQGCYQDHKKAKPCRHHVLAPFDQFVSRMSQKVHEEKCKVHTTENIRYYCRKHDVVGCGDCMVTKHNGCKAEIILEMTMNFEESTDFKEFIKRIEKNYAEKNENVTRLENNIKQNKTLVDKAMEGIRKFRKEINDYLDQAERTIIIQVNEHSRGNEVMFSQLQQKIDEVAKEIDELRKQLDTRVHHGEDLFIRMVECKSKETNIQQTVTEIKSKNMIKTYTFQPDQKLKDMITSNVSFGTIQFRDDNGVNKTTCGTTVNKLVQKSEESSATKQSIAEKKYFPPDPRSAGFEVGKRVEIANDAQISVEKLGLFRALTKGTGKGTIVSVGPTGWINVKWDKGDTCKESAGLGRYYTVQLI